MVDESKTIWCGNLSDKVTEEVLYELFLQAAPLERVRIPTDKEGRRSNFAFITVKHQVSVNYVVQLLNGTSLYDKRINLKPRNCNYSHATPREHNVNNDNAMNQQHQQNVVNNFNNLFSMGHMMQVTYNNCLQPNYNNRQNNGGGERYNNRDKPYNKHHHNRYDNHNRQNRNNHQWNEHRNNYNDRSRRRPY